MKEKKNLEKKKKIPLPLQQSSSNPQNQRRYFFNENITSDKLFSETLLQIHTFTANSHNQNTNSTSRMDSATFSGKVSSGIKKFFCIKARGAQRKRFFNIN